jgi:hypothetical protein
MMRLAREAALLVAFSLLTSTATAYAECAWVLWEQTTYVEGITKECGGNSVGSRYSSVSATNL